MRNFFFTKKKKFKNFSLKFALKFLQIGSRLGGQNILLYYLRKYEYSEKFFLKKKEFFYRFLSTKNILAEQYLMHLLI